MTITKSSPISPAVLIGMMFGWSSFASVRTSRRNVASVDALTCARSGIFSATRIPSTVS